MPVLRPRVLRRLLSADAVAGELRDRRLELATNSVVSVGGAGGLALGAWILRRGGMPAALIARRTVAFFLITSLASVAALIVAGIGLGTGVLHGAPDRALGWAPAALGASPRSSSQLAIPPAARFLARRIGHTSVEKALQALAAGVEEALALLRSRDLAVIAGAARYMLFDVAMLGVCFAAFGLAGCPPARPHGLSDRPTRGLIPLPGGVGGVDGGLIGTLVLYGAGATAAATAVLAYRAIVLLLPLALGVPALRQVRRPPPGGGPARGPVRPGPRRAPGRLGGLAVETD